MHVFFYVQSARLSYCNLRSCLATVLHPGGLYAYYEQHFREHRKTVAIAMVIGVARYMVPGVARDSCSVTWANCSCMWYVIYMIATTLSQGSAGHSGVKLIPHGHHKINDVSMPRRLSIPHHMTDKSLLANCVPLLGEQRFFSCCKGSKETGQLDYNC